MMLHSATRKKKIVDKCYKMGLSISYDRVQEIGNKLGNSVCSEYNSEQLVCPPILRSDLFTVAAVDNIDHNPSSETAKSSFHGTAISLMQFPTLETTGVDRGLSHSLATASSVASEIVLPLVYSSVPPCIFPKLARRFSAFCQNLMVTLQKPSMTGLSRYSNALKITWNLLILLGQVTMLQSAVQSHSHSPLLP